MQRNFIKQKKTKKKTSYPRSNAITQPVDNYKRKNEKEWKC